MEWLKDATNALGQDDSLLNKGLDNSFLNYNGCDFSQFNIAFYTFVIRQTQITAVVVSDEFLKQCGTGACLKYNGCFFY